MSQVSSVVAEELNIVDDSPNAQVVFEPSMEDPKHSDIAGESATPSLQQEEETIKKKYGGLIPKRPPLISKDHERAFFDSADWALGKQGAHKSKGPLEALRPKLQPTPHQQVHVRRSAYAPTHNNGEDGGTVNNVPTDDLSSTLDGNNYSNIIIHSQYQCSRLDGGKNSSVDSEDQSCHK